VSDIGDLLQKSLTPDKKSRSQDGIAMRQFWSILCCVVAVLCSAGHIMFVLGNSMSDAVTETSNDDKHFVILSLVIFLVMFGIGFIHPPEKPWKRIAICGLAPAFILGPFGGLIFAGIEFCTIGLSSFLGCKVRQAWERKPTETSRYALGLLSHITLLFALYFGMRMAPESLRGRVLVTAHARQFPWIEAVSEVREHDALLLGSVALISVALSLFALWLSWNRRREFGMGFLVPSVWVVFYLFKP
jgi:hypothetical protein